MESCDSPMLCDAAGQQCDDCVPPILECFSTTVLRSCTDEGQWMEMDCMPGMCNPNALMCVGN
jgi:hypothetical protein